MTRTIKLTATLAGSNGSASGNQTSDYPVDGKVVGIYVDVTTGSQPNTTDVTVSTAGKTSPAKTLLTVTSASASAWHYPTVPQVDNADAAVTYDGTHAIVKAPPINDYLKVAGAQGNAGSLIVYIEVDD